MIYPQVGQILSNDDITGHLSADFYSIWNNGLVGISWSNQRKFGRFFACDFQKQSQISATTQQPQHLDMPLMLTIGMVDFWPLIGTQG